MRQTRADSPLFVELDPSLKLALCRIADDEGRTLAAQVRKFLAGCVETYDAKKEKAKKA
jgi:hypothetical protein